jgi:hypothetical protein
MSEGLEKRRRAIQEKLEAKGTPKKKAKSSAYAIATVAYKKSKKKKK